jgi:predicted RNase H-like nuclease
VKDLNHANASDSERLHRVQILQGLTWQSYYIAAGIGEIDDFLKDNETAKEAIIESHPEFCFRGLFGHQLSYSKKSA